MRREGVLELGVGGLHFSIDLVGGLGEESGELLGAGHWLLGVRGEVVWVLVSAY